MHKIVAFRKAVPFSNTKARSYRYGGREIPPDNRPFTVEPVAQKSPFPKAIGKTNLQIPGTTLSITAPPNAHIYPISPLMRGDIGHLVAVGFINQKAHFLLIYNMEKISIDTIGFFKKELEFYLGSTMKHTMLCHEDPHGLYQSLTEEKPENDRFYRAGNATTLIGQANIAHINSNFQAKLDPLIIRHREKLEAFLSQPSHSA